MNLNLKSNRSNIIELLFFILFVFIKVTVFHYFMDLDRNLFKVSIHNLLLIISIYGAVALIKTSNKRKVYIRTNFILSVIFFGDAMYYSHFFTLMPAHSIYQVGQLGPVSDSIFSLVRPEYFLFFIDLVIYGIYHLRNNTLNIKSEAWNKKQRNVLITLILASIVISSGLNMNIIKANDGLYTPHSLGLINYHLYDVYDLFKESTVDIARAETIIEQIKEKEAETSLNPKFFGVAEGKNVFVIQAESVQNFVINKKINDDWITPNINKLIQNDSIYFSNYYEQVGWGNTSDAEFISHNGFYPSTKSFSYQSFEENDFTTLPSMLKDKGYETIAFHGNEGNFWRREIIYPSQGIDEFISLEDFNEGEMIGIGLSDAELFNQSISYLKEKENPFYSFYVTLTSHHPFTLEGLQDKNYEGLNITKADEGTVLGSYLSTVHYLDYQVGNFIQKLKEENLYEDSIIIIYGDHQGLDMRNEETNEQVSNFLGSPYKEDDMFNVPFIVHMPGEEVQQEVKIAGGQIDFFPTIANLLGVENAVQTLGKDLLNIKEGFVAKQVHLAKGSFIDDEKIFIMSQDGVFENSTAWNIKTGESVDLEECRQGYKRAIAEVELSEYIMENNLVPLVKEEGFHYVLEYISYNEKVDFSLLESVLSYLKS